MSDKKGASAGPSGNGAEPTEPEQPEEAAAPAAGEAPAEQPAEASPEERVKRLEAEIAELKDRSLRALADAENTRRRAQREVSDTRKYAASEFARELLNVSDNLRRALESVPAELSDKDEQLKNLVLGVEMVEKDLLNAFDKHGIKKIEPLGEPFDHDYHQAMYELEDTGKPSGTVAELLQPGYLIHDRLLRPAMVAVAKSKPQPSSDDPGDGDNSDSAD
jgi:molecular chaperone GrpE